MTALPVCVLGHVIKWRVRVSHPASKAYEASMSTGPPAFVRLEARGVRLEGDWIEPIGYRRLSSRLIPHTSSLHQLQIPVSNRAHRPYESQLGTCRICIIRLECCRLKLISFRSLKPVASSLKPLQVAKARIELACPAGHDVLSVARIPNSATWSFSAARTGVEPVSRD